MPTDEMTITFHVDAHGALRLFDQTGQAIAAIGHHAEQTEAQIDVMATTLHRTLRQSQTVLDSTVQHALQQRVDPATVFEPLHTAQQDFRDAVHSDFTQDLPGIVRQGIETISDTWSGGMKHLVSAASAAADGIGGALANIPGVGNLLNISTLFTSAPGDTTLNTAHSPSAGALLPPHGFTTHIDGRTNITGTSAALGVFSSPGLASAAGPIGAALAAISTAQDLRSRYQTDDTFRASIQRTGGFGGSAIIGSELGLNDDAQRIFDGIITLGISEITRAFGAGKGPTGEHRQAQVIDQLFHDAGRARAPSRIGIELQDTLFGRTPADIRTNRDKSNRGAHLLFDGQDLRGDPALEQFRGRAGLSFGLGSALFQDDSKAAERFAHTITNNARALGLSVQETREQVLALAAEAGVTLPGALLNFNTQLLEGSITTQDYHDATRSLVDLFAGEFPHGVDAAALATAHFTENGRLNVSTFNTALEETVSLFGVLERGAASVFSTATSTAIEALLNGGSPRAAIGQSITQTLSGTLQNFLSEQVQQQSRTQIDTLNALLVDLATTPNDSTLLTQLDSTIEDLTTEIAGQLDTLSPLFTLLADQLDTLEDALADTAAAFRQREFDFQEKLEALTLSQLSPRERLARAEADRAYIEELARRITADQRFGGTITDPRTQRPLAERAAADIITQLAPTVAALFADYGSEFTEGARQHEQALAGQAAALTIARDLNRFLADQQQPGETLFSGERTPTTHHEEFVPVAATTQAIHSSLRAPAANQAVTVTVAPGAVVIHVPPGITHPEQLRNWLQQELTHTLRTGLGRALVQEITSGR